MGASNLVLVASAGGVGRVVVDHLRAQDVPCPFVRGGPSGRQRYTLSC